MQDFVYKIFAFFSLIYNAELSPLDMNFFFLQLEVFVKHQSEKKGQ